MSFAESLRCIRSKYCIQFHLLLLILVILSAVGLVTAMILNWIWTPQPDKDPRIQTPLKTSLHLNIPEDVHYTYICLHHDDWSGCIQLNQMLRGSMTFKITAERTTSEAHHDQSKTTITYGFMLGCSSVFILLVIYFNCVICSRRFCTSFPGIDFKLTIYVMEDPPPESTETVSSPLIAPAVSSKVQQTQNDSTGGACSNRVGQSCAVNIISQIDPSFDAGPELIGTVDGHVKELEAKIKASTYSSEAPLKPKTYDCFIIYSRDDEDFVYNKLIPFFNRNNIKYCEHQEHFELGKNIFDNVNTCITQSRRVVAVLSKSFFASGYCMMDLDAVRGYAASNGYSVQDFLISIKITNFVIPNKYNDMSNSTYADLSEDINDERKWLQIRKALTEFRLASVVMRIEMNAKNCTLKLRLPVQDVSVVSVV